MECFVAIIRDFLMPAIVFVHTIMQLAFMWEKQ